MQEELRAFSGREVNGAHPRIRWDAQRRAGEVLWRLRPVHGVGVDTDLFAYDDVLLSVSLLDYCCPRRPAVRQESEEFLQEYGYSLVDRSPGARRCLQMQKRVSPVADAWRAELEVLVYAPFASPDQSWREL